MEVINAYCEANFADHVTTVWFRDGETVGQYVLWRSMKPQEKLRSEGIILYIDPSSGNLFDKAQPIKEQRPVEPLGYEAEHLGKILPDKPDNTWQARVVAGMREIARSRAA